MFSRYLVVEGKKPVVSATQRRLFSSRTLTPSHHHHNHSSSLRRFPVSSVPACKSPLYTNALRFRIQSAAGVYWPQSDEDASLANDDALHNLRAVVLKPDTTLTDIYAQSILAYGVRKFIGSKMMIRGTLNYMWSSYESFNVEVDLCRHLLGCMGVTRGSRVMVISENRYEWVIVHIATLQLGAHHVVLPTSITPEEAKRVAQATGASVVFVESPASYASVRTWIDTVGEVKHVMCFDDENSEGSYAVAITLSMHATGKTPVRTDIKPEDTAMIHFTPGTTGPPKGVMLSHKALVANVASVTAKIGEALSLDDVIMSMAPWCVCGTIMLDLYQVLIKGAAIIVPPEVTEGFGDIKTVNPSVLVSVALPFQRAYNNIIDEILNANIFKRDMSRLALGGLLEARTTMKDPGMTTRMVSSMFLHKYRRSFGDELRMAIIVGNPLQRDQAELFADLNVFIVNTYACTEAGGIIATDIDVPSRLKVLPGVETRIINENGDVVSPGDIGEILVEAPHAMQGYFDLNVSSDEAKTALQIYGGRSFVRTGDYGSQNGEWITVQGHRDVLIVLDDNKVVEPLTLEAKYQSSPFMKQVFVYGHKRSHVVALIVPLSGAISSHLKKVERRDGSPIVTEKEKAHCIRNEIRRLSVDLPPRHHIRRFMFVDEFTLANGFLTSKWGYARQKIETHYVHYLEALYNEDPKFHGYSVDDYDDLTSLF
eukprot:PhF_6_TR13617/c0_g1_i1/m.21793/K01897/ACSL, fadD; long-chain acyl-CoA synthetase